MKHFLRIAAAAFFAVVLFSTGTLAVSDVQDVTCANVNGDVASINTALGTGKSVHINKGTCFINGRIIGTTPGQDFGGAGRSQTILSVQSSATSVTPGILDFSGIAGTNTNGWNGPILHDFAIVFAQPNTTSRASLNNYKPAIYLKGSSTGNPNVGPNRAKIFRVQCALAMTCVDARNVQGILIDDFEMSPLSRGIWIDDMHDILMLNRVKAWGFGIGSSTNLNTILNANNIGCVAQTTSGTNGPISVDVDSTTGSVDGVYISNSLFVIGMGVCAHSTSGNYKGWMEISNTGFDTFSGLYMNWPGMWINIASSYFTPGALTTTQAVQLNGGTLTCSSCTFYSYVPGPASATIQLGGSGGGAVLNVTGSAFFATNTNAVVIDTTSGQSGKVNVSNSMFNLVQNATWANPVVHVRSGNRVTMQGVRVLDKGTGAGTFAKVDTDDWHNVTGVTAPGWTQTNVAKTYAIFANNNPAFNN